MCMAMIVFGLIVRRTCKDVALLNDLTFFARHDCIIKN